MLNTFGNHTVYQTAQVTQQNMADGSVWKFQYGGNYGQVRNPDNIPGGPDPTAGTVITDPDNKLSSSHFSASSPYDYIDANSHTTSYRYTGGSDFENYDPSVPSGSFLVEVDYPEGGKYLAEYNGAYMAVSKETWVPKPGSPLANAVKQYSYTGDCVTAPSTRQNCAKPTAITDPRGNETDLTYTSFGGVATEWSPRPASGIPRPLKIYSYTQLYAYVKNASGTLVPAATPIWKLTSKVECESTPTAFTPVCRIGGPKTTTSYQYGGTGTVNTLLLRGTVVDSGTGGLNLRTCYAYDNQGNKISETSPRAGLATCP